MWWKQGIITGGVTRPTGGVCGAIGVSECDKGEGEELLEAMGASLKFAGAEEERRGGVLLKVSVGDSLGECE